MCYVFQNTMGKRPKGLLEISEISKQSSRWGSKDLTGNHLLWHFNSRSGKLGPVLTSFHHGKELNKSTQHPYQAFSPPLPQQNLPVWHWSCAGHHKPLLLSLYLSWSRFLAARCPKVRETLCEAVHSKPCSGLRWRWTRGLWATTVNSSQTCQEWQHTWGSGTRWRGKPG